MFALSRCYLYEYYFNTSLLESFYHLHSRYVIGGDRKTVNALTKTSIAAVHWRW